MSERLRRLAGGLWWGWLVSVVVAGPVLAQTPTIASHEFRTTDGVRLHYLEAGSGEPALIFIPGWLMPAQIFEEQLRALSGHHRVLALDPRSQGQSELATGGHSAQRRAADIREFIERVQPGPFVLVGWSLGVMEGLDYVERTRPDELRGLVLVDNSIGEAAPPSAPPRDRQAVARPVSRRERMLAFVRGMFSRPPPPHLLHVIDDSVLRVPEPVAAELLAKPYPREYYKQAIYRAGVPVLYAIRPRFEAQGEALCAHLPTARVSVYPSAGHALFVDESARFNADVERFVHALPIP